jgi:hypothetical protein
MLSERTTHVVADVELEMMRPDSYLVSTFRAAIVE